METFVVHLNDRPCLELCKLPNAGYVANQLWQLTLQADAASMHHTDQQQLLQYALECAGCGKKPVHLCIMPATN